MRKLLSDDCNKAITAVSRFEEYLSYYNFKIDLLFYAESFCADISNLVKLVLLGRICDYFRSDSDFLIDSVNAKFEANIDTKETPIDTTREMTDGRYVNKFASENVISLSSRVLS